MNRRKFLVAAGAATFLPLRAQASEFVQYTPGYIETALIEGRTVFVDFSAKWCSTCQRQERVINEIRAQNPAYDDAMTFVKVDWDRYRGHEVTLSRNIPRRSTLLVLRGEEELGRLVAGTSRSQIRSLMDLGLQA